jgi:lipopolysaccharide biosynthesis glycosyltransferase
MDLDRMRREDTQRQFFEGIRRIKGSRLADQDVINAVLKGKVRLLPCEWNCYDWICDEKEEASDYFVLREEFLPEIRAARRRARIIHFAGKKPWGMEYYRKAGDKYWMYAVETPFYRHLLEQIRRECGAARILWQYGVYLLHEGHFALKQRLVAKEKQRKYRLRLHDLRLRRKGIARQAKFVRALLKAEDRGGKPPK